MAIWCIVSIIFLLSSGDVFRLVRKVMLLMCMAPLTLTAMTHARVDFSSLCSNCFD